MSKLTHLDRYGNAMMVDVGEKTSTHRVAIARGEVIMAFDTLKLIAEGGHKKGDVLSVARIAGIQAAKNCSQLMPLCHPLMLTSVEVVMNLDSDNSRVIIEATCKVNGPTGVEMEALTAASVAALTLYDMCKSVTKGMVIESVLLLHKTGGKSGDYNTTSFHKHTNSPKHEDSPP